LPTIKNLQAVTAGKYVPPAMRGVSTDSAKLARLKRQMQGLLNRVAESNMASVASQIEQIIVANSRGDSNEVLAQLLHALASAGSVTPPRMVAEHILLLALLHAHLGADIGNSIPELLRFSYKYGCKLNRCCLFAINGRKV
jgi:nucleolar MIF4G domain-containing protein 1